MKQLVTTGIVLSRTDYGEADRIVTFLTPDHGKLRVMARGVRKVKSKLAGGIEIFTVSDLTFISGRGEIGTLISARMVKHYGNIVKDFKRLQYGYELIKTLNKATADHPESSYFMLLEKALAGLNDLSVEQELVEIWFAAQLLSISGHAPDLYADVQGQKLDNTFLYNFDFDAMAFVRNDSGGFSGEHIKVLRLLFGDYAPTTLSRIKDLAPLVKDIQPLARTMLNHHISL